MSGNHWLDNCDDDKYDKRTCEKSICRSFDVSVPVTISPFAMPKKPNVKCLRKIDITPGHDYCKRRDNCFKFTITQQMNIDIPVKFGAEVCYKEAYSFDNGKCENQVDTDTH